MQSTKLEKLKQYELRIVIFHEECIVYYESWQIQCCGDPIHVGEDIEWTCHFPEDTKEANGIKIDYEEDHHGWTTHKLRGIITRIIAEIAVKEDGAILNHGNTECIYKDLQTADGWENQLDDSHYTLWGYIIYLKNVTVEPLYKDI